MARSSKYAWRRDAITAKVGRDGFRVVTLPSLVAVGISNALRDALFAFERPILGTTRATSRVQQRAQGHRAAVMVPMLDDDGQPVTITRNGKTRTKMVPTDSYRPMVLLPKKLAEAGAIPEELRPLYDAANIKAGKFVG